jgi:hypothetical protein
VVGKTGVSVIAIAFVRAGVAVSMDVGDRLVDVTVGTNISTAMVGDLAAQAVRKIAAMKNMNFGS